MSYVPWQTELKTYIQAAIANQLTEASPTADQPAWIQTPLRPHQLTLLAGARNLEAHARLTELPGTDPHLYTRYGVLGDRVGAGKSLVALSLVRDPLPEQNTLTIRRGNERETALLMNLQWMPAPVAWRDEWAGLGPDELFEAMGWVKPGSLHVSTSLLFAPHNICQQWETYIKEQTTLNAYFVRRTKDCDYDRTGFWKDVFGSDLVVVSSSMIKKFMGALGWRGPGFSRIVWGRVFVDEADSIQCSIRPSEIQARFTWLITGSWLNMLFPSGLHTFYMTGLPPEVRDLLGGGGAIPGAGTRIGFIYNTIAEGRNPAFTRLLIRNSDTWVDTSLKRPVVTHETVICKAPANISLLAGFISPAAMEALHAGDTTGALSALGLKAASQETLVDRVTAQLRGELTQAEKLLAFKREMEYSSAAAKAEGIKKAEAKVERLREQLADLEARVASATKELCPICYDTPRTATLTPCCRNAFCLSCVCTCLATKAACPLCRTPIDSPSRLMVIGSGDDDVGATVAEATGPPTKGAALLKLLSESQTSDRFLVFSAHEASFKGLREILAARGIRCELLAGSAPRVDRLRKQFQSGEIRVLCMNARHVGAGINLEAATHIVLYHRMNVELEKQVIGRAVRFERSAELRVVHLVHEQETVSNGAAGSEVIVHV